MNFNIPSVEKGSQDASKEKEDKDKKISGGMTRREFISGAGAIGATALLETIYPKSALAKIKDVLDYENVEYESYEDGINRLRDDVFQKNQEVSKFYFKSKKEFETGFLKKRKRNSGWYEARGSKGAGNMVFNPRKSYEVLLREPTDLEEVKMVHTHPYSSSEFFRKKSEAMGVELDSERVRPISFSSMDVFNSLKIAHEFPNSAEIVSHEVVEPTGVWKFKVDGNNENIARVFLEMHETEERIKSMLSEEKSARKKIACDIISEETHIEIKPENLPDKDLLDFEIQSMSGWKELRDMIDMKQLAIFFARKEDRGDTISKTIQEYSQRGINVEYKKF